VAGIVVGLIFSAFAGVSTSFSWFAFSPDLFWHHGQVWRMISYLIVGQVNFFTLFGLMFIYAFGRDCELEMGRGRYLGFLALLILSPVLVATLLWLVGIGGMVVGPIHLSMGLVIAFATIYPNAEWWASIPLKFVAIGCMLLATVGHVSDRDFIGLGSTLATCAASFGYVRALRSGFFSGLSWTALTELFRRKPKFHVLPDLPDKRGNSKGNVMAEMDALLDKIARSGINSLTAKERATLDQSRAELLKRRGSDRN
jgi:membrane associated rhomboid family serine protease